MWKNDNVIIFLTKIHTFKFLHHQSIHLILHDKGKRMLKHENH